MEKHLPARLCRETILGDELLKPKLKKRGNKRALQIRRALEARVEERELCARLGDDYWDNL